jgi:hypothetical protein
MKSPVAGSAEEALRGGLLSPPPAAPCSNKRYYLRSKPLVEKLLFQVVA